MSSCTRALQYKEPSNTKSPATVTQPEPSNTQKRPPVVFILWRENGRGWVSLLLPPEGAQILVCFVFVHWGCTEYILGYEGVHIRVRSTY